MSIQEKARKMVSLSDVMEGREKVNVENIIASYPDGFTVVDFDIIEDRKNNDEYVAIVISEDPKSFFFGGLALTSFFKDLCGEDKEGTRREVQEEGLKMKLLQKRSQNNRLYTAYEIL